MCFTCISRETTPNAYHSVSSQQISACMAGYAEQNTDSRRKHDFYKKPENGVLHIILVMEHYIWKRQEIRVGKY